MSFKIGVIGLLLVLANNVMGAQVVLSPTRYDVGFEVDYDAEVLRGTARIVVQNPSTESVREASLLLYRLLRVKTVRNELQVNQILVTLPEPLAPGAQTAIEVRYEGHLLGYVKAFGNADEIIFAGLFHPERYTTATAIDLDEMVKSWESSGKAAKHLQDADAIVRDLVPRLKERDVVLVMSNGGFGGIHQKLLDALAGPHG